MLSPTDCLTAIAAHSTGLADVIREHPDHPDHPSPFDAVVPSCPGWTVADLVSHVIGVHWFWATIVEDRLTDQPGDELVRPDRAPHDQLVTTLEAGARRLVRVLEAADPSAHVWTWAPTRQDVGFVVRHQVQEIAVHHWDAVSALGGTLTLEPEVAADAIDEFLTVSISSDVDPAGDGAPVLDGTFTLRCVDAAPAPITAPITGPNAALLAAGSPAPTAWRVTDGDAPGTMRAIGTLGAADGAPTISASASDLLLWLYERVEVDTSAVDPTLLQRFRSLTYTT
ncbi:MAG: maleylpyruvate isomerase family mycothiol-dependent enzyme [Lapillicoccus sp.]